LAALIFSFLSKKSTLTLFIPSLYFFPENFGCLKRESEISVAGLTQTLMVRRPSLPTSAMMVVSNHESPAAAAGRRDVARCTLLFFLNSIDAGATRFGNWAFIHGSRQRPSPTGDGRFLTMRITT